MPLLRRQAIYLDSALKKDEMTQKKNESCAKYHKYGWHKPPQS